MRYRNDTKIKNFIYMCFLVIVIGLISLLNSIVELSVFEWWNLIVITEGFISLFLAKYLLTVHHCNYL